MECHWKEKPSPVLTELQPTTKGFIRELWHNDIFKTFMNILRYLNANWRLTGSVMSIVTDLPSTYKIRVNTKYL